MFYKIVDRQIDTKKNLILTYFYLPVWLSTSFVFSVEILPLMYTKTLLCVENDLFIIQNATIQKVMMEPMKK